MPLRRTRMAEKGDGIVEVIGYSPNRKSRSEWLELA
jgi:hypothetical protein